MSFLRATNCEHGMPSINWKNKKLPSLHNFKELCRANRPRKSTIDHWWVNLVFTLGKIKARMSYERRFGNDVSPLAGPRNILCELRCLSTKTRNPARLAFVVVVEHWHRLKLGCQIYAPNFSNAVKLSKIIGNRHAPLVWEVSNVNF